VRKERIFDQIVVNHGTRPLDELYFELKPQSRNLGEVNYEQLIAGHPQAVTKNPTAKFELYRIGDAVSARNTHAAIYDALRLVKDV
jgi:N-methyl-L-proline demethylase